MDPTQKHLGTRLLVTALRAHWALCWTQGHVLSGIGIVDCPWWVGTLRVPDPSQAAQVPVSSRAGAEAGSISISGPRMRMGQG